ncbi:hypothetical protein JAAARDRAFT_206674 [Jaapia argillacea MUCL 33604]|uniref:F-box domain-containing protein n=1 Tax=Jaapia argillacea MUCL 33604 TaxID=933084 RepID=A0A067Q5L7_9AGAM|nr:hypothetical protein JAAARDRAFT_206674 [Jaapia argillacea MUCL 33604]
MATENKKYLPFLSMFLAPGLTWISVNGWESDSTSTLELSRLIPRIPGACPNLRLLEVKYDPDQSTSLEKLVDALSRSLFSLPRLTSIYTSIPLGAGTLENLGAHPSIRTLNLSLGPYHFRRDLTPTIMYSHLASVHVVTEDIGPLTELFTSCSSAPLHSISISLRRMESTAAMQRFLSALCSNPEHRMRQTLKSLCVHLRDVSDRRHHSDDRVGLLIRPALVFRRMMEFSWPSAYPFSDFDDATVLALSHAWPRLVNFHLMDPLEHDGSFPSHMPTASLHALQYLGQRCRRLSSLKIPIEARATDIAGFEYSLSQSKLSSLHMVNSSIHLDTSDDLAIVARYLDDLFPSFDPRFLVPRRPSLSEWERMWQR